MKTGLAAMTKCLSLLLMVAAVAGCAHDERSAYQKRTQKELGHKWYQGEMDNDERGFFLDTFNSNNGD